MELYHYQEDLELLKGNRKNKPRPCSAARVVGIRDHNEAQVLKKILEGRKR